MTRAYMLSYLANLEAVRLYQNWQKAVLRGEKLVTTMMKNL